MLVLGIRNLSQKTVLRMTHIQKMGLPFSGFKALDQKICKPFKLIRYFLFHLKMHHTHFMNTFILVDYASTTVWRHIIIYDSSYQAATSLNSSYCYVLHDGDTLFTWIGNLSSSMDQELAERQLDVIKVWVMLFDMIMSYRSGYCWN